MFPKQNWNWALIDFFFQSQYTVTCFQSGVVKLFLTTALFISYFLTFIKGKRDYNFSDCFVLVDALMTN